LNNPLKPNLLILTSSFPLDPRDETCGYVRDFALKLTTDFNVEVLTLDDEQATEWAQDRFNLVRSKSIFPRRLNCARASNDLNGLLTESWLVKLAAVPALLSYFQTAFRLARRADVVCSHWMVPCGLAGAFISKLLGKPHVTVEHSGALHLLRRTRGGSTVARFITRHSHRVITVSHDLNAKLLALCPDAAEKVEVIPMGVDRSHSFSAYRASPGKMRLLFVGRLTPIKGLHVLLEALRGLNGIGLVVAGDGEQRSDLETLARTFSIDAKFVGRVTASERDDLLSASDIVVIPSLTLADGRTEGMPVICLEAMAAGRPIVAAKVGGLPEIMVDGENGLLFEPGNVDMLSKKLRLLVDDAALRESISLRARETVSACGWESVAPRFVRVIKDSMRSDEPVIHNQRYKTGNANG
jgi:glycosyltransferase involved in cell wall biosynthesis